MKYQKEVKSNENLIKKWGYSPTKNIHASRIEHKAHENLWESIQWKKAY